MAVPHSGVIGVMKCGNEFVGWLGWVGLVSTVLACQPRTAPSEGPATSGVQPKASEASAVSAPPALTSGSSLAQSEIRPTLGPAARMAFHTKEAEAMRLAVISGDRTQAIDEAKELSSDNWTPHLKANWKAHMTPMYEAAREYATATTLRGAAASVGKLGLACANCHRELGGPAPEPSGGTAPQPSMQAHAWAVERLWFGLIAPSDSAWVEGAKQLAASPIVASDVTSIDAEARKLQAFGQTAAAASGTERGAAFGDVINTCATCHRRAGREP